MPFTLSYYYRNVRRLAIGASWLKVKLFWNDLEVPEGGCSLDVISVLLHQIATLNNKYKDTFSFRVSQPRVELR